jgi:hypothetical protein
MVTLLCAVGCFSNSTVLDGTGGGHCPAAVLLSRFHLIVEPLIRHGFHNAHTQDSLSVPPLSIVTIAFSDR